MDDNTRDSYMTLEMKILEETKYASKIALVLFSTLNDASFFTLNGAISA